MSGFVLGAGRAQVTVENALDSVRKEKNMNMIIGDVLQTVYIGTDTRYIVRLGDKTELIIRMQNWGAGYDLQLKPGEQCHIIWDAENAHILAS